MVRLLNRTEWMSCITVIKESGSIALSDLIATAVPRLVHMEAMTLAQLFVDQFPILLVSHERKAWIVDIHNHVAVMMCLFTLETSTESR